MNLILKEIRHNPLLWMLVFVWSFFLTKHSFFHLVGSMHSM